MYDILLPDSFVYTEADQKIEEGGAERKAPRHRLRYIDNVRHTPDLTDLNPSQRFK